MKKFLLILVALLFMHNMANAWVDQLGKRHYRLAVILTSPLGLISKGGIGLENRLGQNSYQVDYTKYWGAYAGYQIGYELQHFFKSPYGGKNYYKAHEYFIYLKGIIGDASFESDKLAIIGDNDKVYIDPHLYAGVGAGFGRRYNFKHFFFSWKVGFKYTAIVDDISTEDKNLYRLFFTTGPGSIVDANFHFGIQF